MQKHVQLADLMQCKFLVYIFLVSIFETLNHCNILNLSSKFKSFFSYADKLVPGYGILVQRNGELIAEKVVNVSNIRMQGT